MSWVLETIFIISISLCVYHVAVYPAALYILAQMFSCRALRNDHAPAVSILIAAYNEEAIIEEKINNALQIQYRNLEIIVVSDGSTDGTEGVIQRQSDPRIRHIIFPSRRGKSAALSAAMELAHGEILLISDANAFCSPDSLQKLVRHFADEMVGVVGGCVTAEDPVAGARSQSVAPSERFYWGYENFIKAQESRIDSTPGVVGSLLALRRSLFEDIPENIINDDLFLALHAMRKGYRVLCEPEARSTRRASPGMFHEAVRRRRICAGRFQLLLMPGAWPWRRPMALFFFLSHKILRLFLPFLAVAAGLASIALMAFPPVPLPVQVVFVSQVACLVALGLGYYADVNRKPWRIPRLVYFVAVGMVSSFTGLYGYAFRERNSLWQKVPR